MFRGLRRRIQRRPVRRVTKLKPSQTHHSPSASLKVSRDKLHLYIIPHKGKRCESMHPFLIFLGIICRMDGESASTLNTCCTPTLPLKSSMPSFLFSKGPLKEASKFANQLSGAVNKKVLGLGDSDAPPDAADVGVEGWEGAEAAGAVTAGGAAGVGMATDWKESTNELGMNQELANNVPSELSIDEQVRDGGIEVVGLRCVGSHPALL